VVLKFDKPYIINNITIGNEHSAFIEISVGNSKQDPPVYQELLFSSSFMTEKDVRNGLNPNRVRFFENSSFVQSVSAQKWDLLKITCTSLTSRKQYGIAFITIYTSDEIDKDTGDEKKATVASTQKYSNTSFMEVKKEEKYHLKKPSPTATKIGKFAFRNSSSDDDEDSSPFKQWRLKKNSKAFGTGPLAILNSEPKTATSIRKRIHSSSDSSEDDGQSKLKVKQDRNRMKGLMYDSDDDEPNERLQKKLDLDRKLKEEEKREPPKISVKSSPKKKFASFFDKELSILKTKATSPPIQIKASTSSQIPKPKKEPQYKPFDKLLNGVTFVISGYQNPERGNLRQKAIDMGARYKGDWDDSCTHLM
jgi:DNA-repair protein XRCC1